MDDSDSDLDDSWLQELEEEEAEYDIFYKDITDIIRVNYIYINEQKQIYHVKKENIDLDNNTLNKEHLIYLLKKNKQHNNLQHKIISILQYNINIKPQDIPLFMKDPENFDFLTINDNMLLF